MPLSIAIEVPATASIREQVEYVQRAETLGFSAVGIPDILLGGRDVFATLAVAAAETRSIGLYPALTNPVTRSPFVLASAIRSIAEIAPGRIALGIGAGDSGVVHAGARPATLSQLREAVTCIVRLLHGEAVAYSGGEPHSLGEPLRDPPPVMLGASGPRTIELAGEIADEAILSVGLSPAILAVADHHLAQGAMRAGRSSASVPIIHYALVSIDDDATVAVERTRYWLTQWLHLRTFRIGLDALGLHIPPFSRPSDLPADLVRSLASHFFIAGTPESVAQQIEKVGADGVERLFCMFPAGRKSHWAHLESLARLALGDRAKQAPRA